MRCALGLVATGTRRPARSSPSSPNGSARRSRSSRSHSASRPRCFGALAAVDAAVRAGVAVPANNELRTVSFAIALIAIVAGVGLLIGVFSR